MSKTVKDLLGSLVKKYQELSYKAPPVVPPTCSYQHVLASTRKPMKQIQRGCVNTGNPLTIGAVAAHEESLNIIEFWTRGVRVKYMAHTTNSGQNFPPNGSNIFEIVKD